MGFGVTLEVDRPEVDEGDSVQVTGRVDDYVAGVGENHVALHVSYGGVEDTYTLALVPGRGPGASFAATLVLDHPGTVTLQARWNATGLPGGSTTYASQPANVAVRAVAPEISVEYDPASLASGQLASFRFRVYHRGTHVQNYALDVAAEGYGSFHVVTGQSGAEVGFGPLTHGSFRLTARGGEQMGMPPAAWESSYGVGLTRVPTALTLSYDKHTATFVGAIDAPSPGSLPVELHRNGAKVHEVTTDHTGAWVHETTSPEQRTGSWRAVFAGQMRDNVMYDPSQSTSHDFDLMGAGKGAGVGVAVGTLALLWLLMGG